MGGTWRTRHLLAAHGRVSHAASLSVSLSECEGDDDTDLYRRTYRLVATNLQTNEPTDL